MAAHQQPTNFIQEVDNILMYYMHVNPHDLSDEQWICAFAGLVKIRKEEANTNG